MIKKIPGELLVFMAALLWSLMGVIAKGTDVSASWMLALRSAAAGLCLSPFLFRSRPKFSRHIVLAGLFYTMFCLLFVWAARLGTVAMAISMMYTAPVYLLGYDMLKTRQITLYKLLPFLLLLAGILLNVFGSMGNAPLGAVLLGVLLGLAFLFYGVFLKRVEGGSPFGIIAMINYVSLAFSLALLPFDFTPAPVSLETIVILLFSGVVISALSYVLYRAGLAQIPLERGLLIALSEMLLNPFLVFLFLGEKPPALILVALLLILAGAVLDIVFSAKKKPQ
ncbi:DMT family transporter [Ruminococcaceae bacterium OttesenSCG-928-I18]|nr:DMT family transporter [Ruminococcaceae bacterium OttesenSCG-928-I18]